MTILFSTCSRAASQPGVPELAAASELAETRFSISAVEGENDGGLKGDAEPFARDLGPICSFAGSFVVVSGMEVVVSSEVSVEWSGAFTCGCELAVSDCAASCGTDMVGWRET